MKIGQAPEELRLAVRMVRRQPWSSVVIVSTLALGIGATTAIYALFNFVLFRPVQGVPDERGLFTARYYSRDQRASAYGAIAALPALRAAVAQLGVERLGAADIGTAAIAASGALPTFEDGEGVTAQYFGALGVRAKVGRLLTDDEAEGRENLVVISERLWRVKLGGAPDAIGRTLALNGHPFVVVGVTDRFRGWSATRIGTKDWWVPIGTLQVLEGYPPRTINAFIGRVRPGSSLASIQQQLQATYTNFATTLSARDAAFVPFVSDGLQGSGATAVRRSGMRMYWLLLGAAGLLLLLACANAAILVLARASQRTHDTAVRMAMGAGRGRVLRQFFLEAIVCAALAGALGVAIAWTMTRAFRGMRIVAYLPEIEAIDLDGRVIVFCVTVAFATACVFGLIPAIVASRTDVRGMLGQKGRGVAGTNRLRHALVIGQMALSLVLVANAAVLNRSLQNLFAADLGMKIDGVYKLSLKPDELGYKDARAREVVTTVFDALRGDGFDVASSSPEPLSGNQERITVELDNGPPIARTVFANSVSTRYFDLLKMHLVQGRGFTDEEVRSSGSPLMPVVLSVSLASDLFGGAPALGRTFGLTRVAGIPSTAVVVGIVDDTRSSEVRGQARKALYHTRPSGWRYTQILVRPVGPAAAALGRIRTVVHDVDPALPITALRPLIADLDEELSQDRVLARLSGLVAILAALLGAAGVLSVVSWLVVERTREFGIRAALGASQLNILRHVLAGVAGRAMAGVAIGLGVYWWVSTLLAERLYRIDRLDPITMVGCSALLVSIAVLASLLPARRAARTDPATALRAES